MRLLDPSTVHDQPARDRASTSGSTLALLMLMAALLVMSWFMFDRTGLQGLAATIGIIAFGIIFAAISIRNLMVPVLIWLVFLMGFRNMLFVHTPGLPDISPDRVLFVWIFSIFMLKLALGEKPYARWHLLDTLLVVHLFYLLGSIMVHEYTGMNSWTRSYLMGYGAYFIGKYIIDGRLGVIRFIFGFLLVLNIYFGVIAVAEFFKINALIWPKMILNPATYREWPGRSHGPFLQPAVFGIVMGMLLPIQIYFLRSARNMTSRLLLYASLPLVLAGLYFTYTRGSWLAGIFGVLAMGLVNWRRYLPLVSRLIIIGALLLAVGVINFKQDQQFARRMAAEHTVTGRLSTLGRTYRIFLDYPIFGCGYFRYNSIKREYVDTIEVPIFGTIERAHDIEAGIHDMYLGILAEEGLVGAGLHLAIYLQIFFLFRRKYLMRQRGDPFAVDMMPAMAGLMVGYLIGGLSIDYRYFSAMIALLYLMVGMIASYRPATSTAPRQAPNPNMRFVEPPRLPEAW